MEVFEPLPRDKKGRPVNPEDAEARAAAKERRRARDAANKAAAEERKAKAAQKAQAAEPAPAPKKKGERPAPTVSAEQTPARKKRARGYRASATLEEALTATAPARPVRESGNRREEEFHHTDPLAGDVIMDATARLLAPRPRMFQSKEQPRKERPARRSKSSRHAGEENGQEKRPSHSPKEEKQARPAQKKSMPAKALDVLGGGKKKRNGRGKGPGRPREVELRTDGVKDSTELSSSLMKPYYLSDD